MNNYDSVFTVAAQLPLADRIQLIEALWETLPEDGLPPLSAEWVEEINRRSAELDCGAVATIPWEQVRAEALRRIGRGTA